MYPCSIPQVILGGIFKPPADELGFQIYVSAYNTIFLFIAISTAYGMVSLATLVYAVQFCEVVGCRGVIQKWFSVAERRMKGARVCVCV